MKNIMLPLVLGCLAFGCQTPGSGGNRLANNSVCGSGELTTFTLTKPAFALDSSAVGYSPQNGANGYQLLVEEPTADRFVTLDACLDQNDDVTPIRLTVKATGQAEANLAIPSTQPDSALKTAIFNEDYRGVNIVVPATANSSAFALRGWAQSGGSYLTAAKGSIQNGVFAPNDSKLIAGVLTAGAPPSAGCQANQTFAKKSFPIGAAVFDVEFCHWLGGGLTTAYDLTKVTITDANLSSSPVTLTKSDMTASNVRFAWHHHNTNDSLYIKVSGAEYGAISSTTGGSAVPVNGAPARPSPDTGKVYYSVTYGNSTPRFGKLDCDHYLLPLSGNCVLAGSAANLTFELGNSGEFSSYAIVGPSSLQINFETPQGDQADPERNTEFGFFPIFNFNRVSIAQGSAAWTYSIWRDTAPSSQANDVFCKILTTIKPPASNNYPLTAESLFQEFGLTTTGNGSICGNFVIPSPASLGGNSFTSDRVCLIEAPPSRGSGIPQFVMFHYPYLAFDSIGSDRPGQVANLCIDGKHYALSRGN